MTPMRVAFRDGVFALEERRPSGLWRTLAVFESGAQATRIFLELTPPDTVDVEAPTEDLPSSTEDGSP